jgi:hypothetical protein
MPVRITNAPLHHASGCTFSALHCAAKAATARHAGRILAFKPYSQHVTKRLQNRRATAQPRMIKVTLHGRTPSPAQCKNASTVLTGADNNRPISARQLPQDGPVSLRGCFTTSFSAAPHREST